MRIALIGFQKSGKTTVFNALTGQHAETSAFATGQATSNHAVVKVPDPRLDKLAALFKPKKQTPATVDYIDLAGIARPEGDTGGQGLGEKQMVEISTADALLAVVRGFNDPATGDEPDIEGDVEAMCLEMALSDLQKLENRTERIGKQMGRASGKEKEAFDIELDAIGKLRTALEQGKPARAVELTDEQHKMLRGFQMLTMKPVMFLINDDEARWAAGQDKPVEIAFTKGFPNTLAARLCGLMEMEIAQLPEEDRAVFLESYGITEPAANRIIRLCYELLGRISFLTVGPDECRAWTIMRGDTAPLAAGAIHSDLERGFIRAEVINWQDLLELGSYAEAKKKGKLRLEGKAYVVQDGDVMNILFNV